MTRTTPDQATLFRTVTYILALWGSSGRDAASRLASLRDQPNVRGVGAWERGRCTRGRSLPEPFLVHPHLDGCVGAGPVHHQAHGWVLHAALLSDARA
jgi:hypothetical protein